MIVNELLDSFPKYTMYYFISVQFLIIICSCKQMIIIYPPAPINTPLEHSWYYFG